MRKGFIILLGLWLTVSVSAQRFVKSLDTLSQMSLSPIDLHTNAFVPGQGIFTQYYRSGFPNAKEIHVIGAQDRARIDAVGLGRIGDQQTIHPGLIRHAERISDGGGRSNR